MVGPHVVLYSAEDHAFVSGLCLAVVRKTRPYVAARPRGTQGRGGWKLLHRILLNLPPRCGQVDHVNGDGLDNRRENIRPCTNSQNQMNRRKLNNHKTASQYKGVVFELDRGCWRAQLKLNGKKYRGPRRKSEMQAALDYDDLARKHFGEFARLNFPVVVVGPDDPPW